MFISLHATIDDVNFCDSLQWFYLAIFTALYMSHSQSKSGLYFPNFMHFSTYYPNFMYFSTYLPNFYEIFSQTFRKRKITGLELVYVKNKRRPLKAYELPE